MLLAVVGVSLTAAPGLDGVLGAFLGALMLAIAASDFRRYIIPNELTGAALALALFRAGAAGPEAGWEALIWAAGRGLAIALPFLALMTGYRWWRGRDGLGLGDIKLAAVSRRVAQLRNGLCSGRARDPVGARRLLRERLSQEASAQGNGAASIRAVPRTGDLDRLAGRGDVKITSLSCFWRPAAADA